jgi:resuscitation-promoting factor RpfB
MPLKAGYLMITGIGGLFLWSGIKGKSFSGSLKEVIGGDSPSSAANADTITPANYSSSTSSSTSGATSAELNATTQSISSVQAQQNQKTIAAIAIAMGHPSWVTGTQWTDWVALWNQESGWNQYAANPSSGAYGIPQSLPYTKMPKAAWPSSDGGSSSVTAQGQWGIMYIAQTYGSPSAAWAHEESNGWY